MLSNTRIEEIVKLQDTLNKVTVGLDWRQAQLTWHIYAWVEAAEAVESLGYKHWKAQEVDYENVKVELIDIVHFIISHYLVDSTQADIVHWMNSAQSKIHNTKLSTGDNASDLIKQFNMLVHYITNNNDPQFTFDLLFSIWEALGETPETLYKAYITKNVLNSFRQTNGYKDGTYKKLWVFRGKEVEDNVVAYALAENINVEQDFVVSLKAALRNTYKGVK